MSRWSRAAALAAGALFLASMLACLERAWHAPSAFVIAVLFAMAIALGAEIARRRHAELAAPFDYRGILSSRAAGIDTFVVAIVAATAVGTIGLCGVIALVDSWRSLAAASIVGSAYIASVVLLPVAFHVLLEAKVSVGLDAIAIARAFKTQRHWLRDVTSATADRRAFVFRLRDAGETRLAMTTPALAQRFATLVTERVADVEIPLALARSGRSLVEWRKQLTAMDYRNASLATEDAVRVLRSGRATRDERMGAAIVLAGLGAREKVLEARNSFVDPSMRGALERIADETLDDAWIRWTERDSRD